MKIKKLLLLYGINILALACTHSEALKQDSELYSEFKHYTTLVLSHNDSRIDRSQQIFDKYTPRKQKSLVDSQVQSATFINELVNAYLSFPIEVAKEFNHYETIEGDHGCLLINGYTHQREPMAVTINYSNASDWLIDDVHVEYLAPFNKFLGQAICDYTKLDEIRLKEMM